MSRMRFSFASILRPLCTCSGFSSCSTNERIPFFFPLKTQFNFKVMQGRSEKVLFFISKRPAAMKVAPARPVAECNLLLCFTCLISSCRASVRVSASERLVLPSPPALCETKPLEACSLDVLVSAVQPVFW